MHGWFCPIHLTSKKSPHFKINTRFLDIFYFYFTTPHHSVVFRWRQTVFDAMNYNLQTCIGSESLVVGILSLCNFLSWFICLDCGVSFFWNISFIFAFRLVHAKSAADRSEAERSSIYFKEGVFQHKVTYQDAWKWPLHWHCCIRPNPFELI